jgi:hypothetical protein
MKIALLHLAPRAGDLDFNRRLLETAIDTAAGQGAEWVVTWDEPLPHEAREDAVHGIQEQYLPDTERRNIPLQCGDVLVLGRYTPHRFLPVATGQARWAVAMWVKAADAGPEL